MKKNEVVVCVHGGHAEIGSRGASGYIDEVTCDRWVADEITQVLRENGFKAWDISVHNGTQNTVLNDLKVNSERLRATHNISCHFNSFTKNTANGFEIYFPKNWNYTMKSYQGIQTVMQLFCAKFMQINRGLKSGGNLFVCNNLKNCILVEFAFVSNRAESKLYNTEKKCRKKARKFATLYIKHYLNKEIDI